MTTPITSVISNTPMQPTAHPTGSAPDVSLVSQYALDGGSAADSEGGVNGTIVGTWDSFNPGSLANGVAGTSFYKTATSASVTLPASQAAHALQELTLSFYYQPAASTIKHVLFACAAASGSAAGDFSIERQGPGAAEGRLRVWHVGQGGGLVHVGGDSLGIVGTNLQVGTAYRITLTFGPAGLKIYLDDALVGSVPQNINGWNNARVKYLGIWVDGVTWPAEGVFDHVRIWDGQLTLSGVQALEAAQSVGGYEQIVASFTPAIYLKLGETSGSTVADSSGNLRSGTITGTPSGYNVTALPSGALSGGLNLGSGAFISVAHAAVDVALTTPSSWETEQSTSGYRFIAGATISVWFNPQALPTGSTKAVIFAKSHTATPGDAASYAETHPMAATPGSTVNGGSFEAFYDSAGAVHVECRSFRGRPCRVRTPNGAVSVGTAYHLVVQLSYDGVAAWLDGAKFEDGYANLLHVHGLASNMHGIVFANNYDWTLGKAAWGGQADIIVDEFAVYLHAPSADLTQSNINALAEIADTPAALAHHIWGALTVNESSYATINAAINDVNASGGGTVLIDPGTYAENITLKSNVRLKANGGTVQINGQVRTGLSLGSSIGAGSGDFETGDRTLTIANSRAVGDLIRVRGTWVDPTTATAARWDRRWNTTGESNAPGHPDAQLFEIETRTASSMTFVGEGSAFDFRNGSINILQAVNPVTPCSNVALEGDLRFSATNALSITLAKNMRIIGITSTNANLNAQSIDFISSIYVQLRNVTNVQANMTTPGSNNDGIYFQFGTSHAVCKDCLTQEGRHGFDNALHYNGAVAYGNEFHDCEWSNLVSRGTGGISNAWCTHMGMNTLFWNMHTNFGGPGNTGWRVDSRWCVCGNASENSGAISCEDGAKEIYLRDLHIYRPTSWFEGFSGSVSVDNCRFENITHSATPTRTPHVNLSYGTGALVNTYSNVDTFSGSWTAV